MDRRKLIKRLIYLIFFILLANFLANKFYWYSTIWWFDMPMHFLGGFWIGLASIYLFFNQSFKLSPESKDSVRTIFKILFFVLLVGVGWEVFEIFVNDVIAKNPFNYLDTISDIFFDLSGGAFSFFYFLKRILITTP